MKTTLALFPIAILFTLVSSNSRAATVDEIIAKIDENQSLGLAYLLTVEEIEQLEQSSDPAAHYYLGLVYADGDTPNTGRDQCKAAEYMTKSARMGDPFAHFYLAFATLWGISLEIDGQAALTLVTRGRQLLAEQDFRVPYNFKPDEKVEEHSLLCLKYLKSTYPDTGPSLNFPVLTSVKPCLRENDFVTRNLELDPRFSVSMPSGSRESLNCKPQVTMDPLFQGP